MPAQKPKKRLIGGPKKRGSGKKKPKGGKPAVGKYRPHGIRIGKRFYEEPDLDHLIDAVGIKLPDGSVSIDVLNEDATARIRRVHERRQALAIRLESAARAYDAMSEAQDNQPSHSALKKRFETIAQTAARLRTQLGLAQVLDQVDFEIMPHPIRLGLANEAEAHGERIGGFADMPPLKWEASGIGRIDYLGDEKLRQAIEGICLLQIWASAAFQVPPAW